MSQPRRVKEYIAFAACAAAFLTIAMLMDLRLRAKAAYLEAEKYASWVSSPELKKDFFEKAYAKRFKELDSNLANGRISRAQFEDQRRLLTTEKDFKIGESSTKYAYIWYKTAAETFSPPRTDWAEKAKAKMPDALELWKKELRAAKIDFKDYMLE